MIRDIENVVEVLVLLAVFYFLMKSRESFSADPYGSGLRYFTFNDGVGNGLGSNQGLANVYNEDKLITR